MGHNQTQTTVKIVKYLVIAIMAVIALVLVTAIFTKRDYAVEREITIAKPKQDVYNYIKLLRNQVHYSKWVMMDPNAKMDYTGTDGTVGFVSAWDSENKKVGKGSQTITKLADGERMDLGIHFIKPFEGTANAYMTTESVADNQTKVKWGFTGTMKYPMNIMLLCMHMDDAIGGDLQTGLNNLKGVLEK